MSGASSSTGRIARSAIAARQIPADLHIAEHEHHRERIALERDAEGMTHGAVRPVAADDVAEDSPLYYAIGVPQLERRPGRPLAQCGEFNASSFRPQSQSY